MRWRESSDPAMPHLLVIGTGLIGGSFALAMRKGGCFAHIDGHDSDAAAAASALRLGHIDAVAPDLNAAIARADAVLVAVPIAAVASTVQRVCKLNRTATVIDVGSVKGSVLEALRKSGAMPPGFVPCHPMAGSEKRGPEAADAGLFRDRPVILTPQPETDPKALARVREWWSAAGARVVESSAPIHDEMVALTSHLPHLVAYAFMNWVGKPHGAVPADFAGPGLHGFTRIAASDAAMWRQILSENRAAVLAQYDGLVASMDGFVELLRNERFDELEALLAQAQATRLRMIEASGQRDD
jgi:prephenate dehydrogenase